MYQIGIEIEIQKPKNKKKPHLAYLNKTQQSESERFTFYLVEHYFIIPQGGNVCTPFCNISHHHHIGDCTGFGGENETYST